MKRIIRSLARLARIRFIIALVISLMGSHATAEVERFEVISREPFADGAEFGDVGAYERIVGKVHFTIDPSANQNQSVVDLQFVKPDADGLVRYSADLFILAPADTTRSNGAAIYDVNNRGRKRLLAYFNYANGINDPKTLEDAGDGFLFRHGFTIVWSGWDGELIPGDNRLQLHAPIARRNDESIKGLVRCEFEPGAVSRSNAQRANHGGYFPSKSDGNHAALTKRATARGQRVLVPADQWQLHVTEQPSEHQGQLPLVEVEMKDGFEDGQIYELVYEAKDPIVHGLCFTSVRDLMSAIKYGDGLENPLTVDGRPFIQRALGWGISQSGRFLRELVYWGLNQDEKGRQAFDAVMPHVSGGGLGSFNQRFAQPTRFSTQRHQHDYPIDRFPFSYSTQRDPYSGWRTSLTAASDRTNTTPLIMHTQSTAEYWTRAGSLPHTDPMGIRDARVPRNVRFYTFGGTQHGPSAYPPTRGKGQALANPGDYKVFLRALMLHMDNWVNGVKPPPSVYPSIKDGTLVSWDQASTGFPNLAGIRYAKKIHTPAYYDFGPKFLSHGIVEYQPPSSWGDYVVLVPICDEDGNELGCLSPPEVMVPIATYTGWNMYAEDSASPNSLVGLNGSYIPFPVTTADKGDDPRQPLQERYGSLKYYIEKLSVACDKLVDDGYLLEEDAKRTIEIQETRLKPIFQPLSE